jgi:hypothetical protein
VSTSSSGDDGAAGGRRAWDVLSGREEQDKSWLREVMDERKKLAADKRKSQEATLPPKSPRLVNLTVSVRRVLLCVCVCVCCVAHARRR